MNYLAALFNLFAIFHLIYGYATIGHGNQMLAYDKDTMSVVLVDSKDNTKDLFVLDGTRIVTETSLNASPDDCVYLGGRGGYETSGTPVSTSKNDYFMALTGIENGKNIRYGIRKYFKSPVLARNLTGNNVMWFSDVVASDLLYDEIAAWDFRMKKMFGTIGLFRYKNSYLMDRENYTRITSDTNLYFSPDVGISLERNPNLTDESRFTLRNGKLSIGNEFMVLDESYDHGFKLEFVKDKYLSSFAASYFVLNPTRDALIYYGHNAYELVMRNGQKSSLSLKPIIWDWNWFDSLEENAQIFSDEFRTELYSCNGENRLELELENGGLVEKISREKFHIHLRDIKYSVCYGTCVDMDPFLENNQNGWFLTMIDPRVHGVVGEKYQLMVTKCSDLIKFKPVRS